MHLRQNIRIKVRQIGQLRAVQLLEHTGFNQVRQQVGGGHYHVITTAPGHEFALHDLAVIEHVIRSLGASLRLEVLQRVRGNKVVPVVNIDLRFGGLSTQHQAAEKYSQTPLHASNDDHENSRLLL